MIRHYIISFISITHLLIFIYIIAKKKKIASFPPCIFHFPMLNEESMTISHPPRGYYTIGTYFPRFLETVVYWRTGTGQYKAGYVCITSSL